jgi:hypothetical protein
MRSCEEVSDRWGFLLELCWDRSEGMKGESLFRGHGGSGG